MKKQDKKSKRAMVVFAGLLTILTGTSALLLAVAPESLKPDGTAMLASNESAGPAVDGLFNTNVPVKEGRWEYVYIRHSRTSRGDTQSLPGDHFVIHCGNGGADGQIQMSVRWANQASATPPPGAKEINPRCVSIVLVGDLDRNVPTPAQLQSTTQLVHTLQQQMKIPAQNVLMLDQKGSAASVGKFFPTQAFKENLLQ